jgi:hypothetical protein
MPVVHGDVPLVFVTRYPNGFRINFELLDVISEFRGYLYIISARLAHQSAPLGLESRLEACHADRVSTGQEKSLFI